MKKKEGNEEMQDKSFFAGVREWADDIRMEKLLGPLPPSREIDCDSWDNTIKFWEKLVFDSCRHYDNLAVSLETLKSRFTRKGIEPMCLESVLVLAPRCPLLQVKPN